MMDYLLGLGVSDVCDGWPGAAPYVGTQAAHAAIGGVGVFAPLAVRLVILMAWICKEIFADIGGCGRSGWVALDSLADIAFAFMGFAVAHFALRNSASATWGKQS